MTLSTLSRRGRAPRHAALLLIVYNIILIWREFDRMTELLAEMERAWLKRAYPDHEPENEAPVRIEGYYADPNHVYPRGVWRGAEFIPTDTSYRADDVNLPYKEAEPIWGCEFYDETP